MEAASFVWRLLGGEAPNVNSLLLSATPESSAARKSRPVLEIAFEWEFGVLLLFL